MTAQHTLAPVQVVSVDLDALRAATRRLLRDAEGLDDERVREPSRLPGWNRAEVLAHLARNADGTTRMVEAAARGEVAAQYPGGIDQRAADIAAGRDERMSVLLADVRRSHDRMMDAFTALPADAWDRIGRAISTDRTMRAALWSRLREVEIHHVDLAVGYESSDWPVPFVNAALEEIFTTFPARMSNRRPRVDAVYQILSTDHDRMWRVTLDGAQVAVEHDADGGRRFDGEARGWGCDVVAWLYGRDPSGAGILASGDVRVIRLPQWFPFA
jgi:maleylpyruvate isomerase